MSAQNVDPIERWRALFHGSDMTTPQHTRLEWEHIADAIHTADRLFAERSHNSRLMPVRGDATWCRIAVDATGRLAAADPDGQPHPLDEPVCVADERLIRAWLDAPWVPPTDAAMTIAQAQGIDIDFDPHRDIDPASVTLLVDLAQRAGVFGAEGHHIDLLRWAANGELRDDLFLVTVAAWDRPGVGTPPVGVNLLAADRSSPVATVIVVLQGVADVVNTILAAETSPAPDNVVALWPGQSTAVHQFPPAPAPTAFPPLRLVYSATATPDEPPPSAPGGGPSTANHSGQE